MSDVINLKATHSFSNEFTRVVRENQIEESIITVPEDGTSVNLLDNTDTTRYGCFLKFEGAPEDELELSFNGVSWFTVYGNTDLSDILGQFARYAGNLLARTKTGTGAVDCYVAIVE